MQRSLAKECVAGATAKWGGNSAHHSSRAFGGPTTKKAASHLQEGAAVKEGYHSLRGAAEKDELGRRGRSSRSHSVAKISQAGSGGVHSENCKKSRTVRQTNKAKIVTNGRKK